MIRGLLQKCPFGLPISSGCKCAGGIAEGTDVAAIKLMTPIDWDSDETEDLGALVLLFLTMTYSIISSSSSDELYSGF